MESNSTQTTKSSMIFFLRHAERADCAGPEEAMAIKIAIDPHLTELGKLQSRYAAKEIQDMVKKDHNNPKYLVVSSPFLRCLQTSVKMIEVFGKDNIVGQKIYVDNFLSEFLNQLYFKESPMESLHLTTKSPFMREYVDFDIQDGLFGEGQHTITHKYPETVPEQFERVTQGYEKTLQTFSNILKENENTILVLITHGYGVQCLLDYYDAFDFDKGVEYTCLSQIFFDASTGKGRIGEVQLHRQLEKADKEYQQLKKKLVKDKMA